MGKQLNMDFVVWMHQIEKNACDLLDFRGFTDSYLLKDGVSLAEVWPNDVEMEMNEDHPNDIQLVDSLFNIKSLKVISTRLKNFLETQELPDVEFLPVNIKDHKGKYSEEDYFILNLIEHVDCLDAEASHAEESMLTDDIMEVKGIVLKQSELLEGRKLFRLRLFGEPTIIDRELAAKMEAEGFSGIKWRELKEYTDKTW